MNRKLCAPADKVQSWESINWKKAEDYVRDCFATSNAQETQAIQAEMW